MNILLVSQCNKRALTETRRVIDQFAERRGDRTWQTAITKIGIDTLRKLLKKTARRNTAVACHWIRSKNHTELMWIVGNMAKFNEQGAVPTNFTQRNILKSEDENHWHSAEDIALLAGLAALFHDFGKANVLFQKKLKPNSKAKLSEPYRHEWVSLRMFEAFAAGQTDEQWLSALAAVSEQDNSRLLQNLLKDHPAQKIKTPFNPENTKPLAPMARAVAWLILTHHKLPQYKEGASQDSDLDYVEDILDHDLHPTWNSPQIFDSNEYQDNAKPSKWQESELAAVWDFKDKTPLLSSTWRAKAQRLATRALQRRGFCGTHWLDETFTLHLSRMALMMADHHFSSLAAHEHYQDKKYKVWANTDRKSGDRKQQLDEHLIGVYCHSLRIVRILPTLKHGLAAISRHKVLKQRSQSVRFNWQNKAYDIARSISESSERHGFFGINMASTGQGKTFANARVMYGLSNPAKGCRFSIALGLRTLTLQTGEALSSRLKLDSDDIAVLIGSQAVKQLYDLAQRAEKDSDRKPTGSESANDLLDEDQYVTYEGITDGPLKGWLEQKPKLNKLVNAPILVSTIDHLMPATESDRGGKQIAPMLRLLTADLVLDEIDDFDLADLPAICRLVNWAGLLGCRVLLSSATLPPALVNTLFDAYANGRAQYQKARGEPGAAGRATQIHCAWFDEFNATAALISNQDEFAATHHSFVDKRITELQKAPPIRQAKLVPVSLEDADQKPLINGDRQRSNSAVSALANRIFQSIIQLHQEHHSSNANTNTNTKTEKRVSIGLVRMANINPMVAMAKQLFTMAAPADTEIHYCVYHSRFALVVRSAIEAQLDSVLRRDDPNSLWQQPSIMAAIKNSRASNHLFVVIGSPVCEVGRDHDYDWAVVEPSSMRSIIQLAGRVQRHRNQLSDTANIHLLSQNYKGLAGREPVFCKPGFESGKERLTSRCLDELLTPAQYQVVSAINRIKLPTFAANHDPKSNLASFEHQQLANRLSEGRAPANIWWYKPLSLTYEWQRRTRFRQSAPSEDYVFWLADEQDAVQFKQWQSNGELKLADYRFKVEPPVSATFASGVSLWGRFDYSALLMQQAEQLDMSPAQASMSFGAVNLQVNLQQQDLWLYDEVLGFYQAL